MEASESLEVMTTNNREKIKSILEAIEIYNPVYQREAINEALSIKEEITPIFLDILRDVLKDPQKYIDEDKKLYSYIYSCLLLSHFKEPAAHDLFLKLFEFPEEISEPLFGDVAFDLAEVYLYQTCHGKIDGLKSLIQNRKAYIFCRSAAATALIYCVADGSTGREEVLEFFSLLFTGDEADPEDLNEEDFWSHIANCMKQLYPDSVMNVLGEAFDKGLLQPYFVNLEEIETVLKTSSPEQSLADLRLKMEESIFEDVHEYMQSWSCFRVKGGGDDSYYEDFFEDEDDFDDGFDDEYEDEDDYKDIERLQNTCNETSNAMVRSSKIGRNELCPCQSGKKYKKCCMS